jgi:hypothetical protein
VDLVMSITATPTKLSLLLASLHSNALTMPLGYDGNGRRKVARRTKMLEETSVTGQHVNQLDTTQFSSAVCVSE